MRKLLVALLATFTAHASATVATLTVPVLAPHLQAIYGVDGRYVGLYSSAVYFGSLITTILSVHFIKSIGALNSLKSTLVLSIAGMVALSFHNPFAFFASALIIGFSFGPMNPVSSVILAGTCPPRMRGRVFSIKQGAVPFGAGITALAVPFVHAGYGMPVVVAMVIAVCLAGLLLVQLTGAVFDEKPVPSVQKRSARTFLSDFVRTFQHRDLRRIVFVSTGLAGVQFTFAPTLIYVLVSHGGYSAGHAGGVLSAVMLLSFFMRPVFGAMADLLGARAVVVGISASVGVFSVIFPFLLGGGYGALTTVMAIIYGVTCFSWNGVALSMLANRAPADLIGEATAGNMAVSLVGATIAPVIFTALMNFYGGPIAAYLSLACFAAFALVFAISVGKK